jgi:hypothetical protein
MKKIRYKLPVIRTSWEDRKDVGSKYYKYEIYYFYKNNVSVKYISLIRNRTQKEIKSIIETINDSLIEKIKYFFLYRINVGGFTIDKSEYNGKQY